MTQRDTFPFEDDKRVILSFLKNKLHHTPPSDWLWHTRRMLTFNDRHSNATIAWYAPDGSLQAKLATSPNITYSRHVINHIMLILGEPTKTVIAEHQTHVPGISSPGPYWFFDGSPITLDQPFVLVGPVGMLAYRAALTTSPTSRASPPA